MAIDVPWIMDRDLYSAVRHAKREQAIEWVREHPDDPSAEAIATRSEQWWQLNEDYTREVFGFVGLALERSSS